MTAMYTMPAQRRIEQLVIVLILAAACWTGHVSAQAPRSEAEALETVCRLCHRDKFDALQSNPHRVLDSPEWRERTQTAPVCLNCHSDAASHIESGGGLGNVFAFREEAPTEQTEVCLGCHASTHPEFDLSPHAQTGMTCTNCHSQHSSAPGHASLLQLPPADVASVTDRLGAASTLCADCHGDILVAFDFNERHRLREGVLECTSCHNPHAAQTRTLLGGFKQDQCIECHTDKGGPFVFEHAAVRVEGCTACHTPHGSPNRHLLAHQRPAELCISCHANIPQFHLGFNPAEPPRFDLDTQCTNCHSAIHGSNFDSHFLR
jgi:DmsE family decaheme c-type cytochrome